MSSTEKAPKSKPKAPSKTKSSKGKEVSVNDQRFRGDGVKFKCKLVGSADVASARGDSMCAEAIKKLKVQVLKLHKESGEHKQKIVMYISIKGIRIVDEKTQKVQYEHPINKISFITHDPEDKRIFGYVCSQPCTTGHKMYAIKSEKPAGAVTGTLYELFQVVFKLRQEAGLSRKVQNSSQVQKPPQVSNGPSPSSPPPSSDGIYEVPYKNGNNKQATPSPQLDHEYAEPVKPSRNDPHYKVPTLPPAPAAPSSQTGEKNWEEHKDNEKTMSADAPNTLTLLNQSQSFDKEPDQVSQASIPDSPFPTHDSSSTDMNFFGSSVFDTAPSESGAADSVSVASSADVSMLRSGSVSSGSSDTRSAHSRSGSLNQKAATEEVHPGFATTFDDNGQTGQEVWERMSEENNPVAFPSSGEEEKVGEKGKSVAATVEESFASNPDPFASSTNEDERTQPVAGEGFFTESFAAFDTAFGDFEAKKSDVDNQEKDELSSNDPFARPVTLEQGSVTESGLGFASESNFEAAFSSEKLTQSQPNTDAGADDENQGGRDENPVEEKSKPAENSSVSFSWDTSFGENEDAPQQNTTQSAVTSETVQFSWAESFASDNADVTAKPSTSASFNWDDAFGGAPVEEKESSNQAQDAFSWDNAFGDKATNGSDWQFESSPFGDAFSSASKVESSSDKPSVSDLSAQPVAQSTASENPSTFEDSAFSTPSSLQMSESKEDVSVSGESNKIPPPSKDPFEEFKVSFPSPGTNFVEITSEETADSSESEGSNTGEELSPTKENTSDEVRLEENAKETVDLEEINETANQAEDHDPAPRAKYNTEVEQVKEERPSELQVQESRLSLSERPISPTAPPPLPPRPAVSAPPLPARPPSSSSTVSTGMTPVSQHSSTGSPSNSPHQGKKGSAKKTPPPPPPRVDLNENSGNVSSDKKETFPDPFGSNLFDHQFDNDKDVTEDGSSDWEATWPSAPEIPPKEKTKDLSDPFSDNFFTNFDFPQKPASNKAVNDNLDPFATTNPTSEAFPVAFGNEDLFAAFTPAKVDVAFGGGDPFQNDLSDSFSAFPSDDPFSDISDPFADKGILGDDPFGDSPSKPHLGESLTLNESLVASDEADSFA